MWIEQASLFRASRGPAFVLALALGACGQDKGSDGAGGDSTTGTLDTTGASTETSGSMGQTGAPPPTSSASTTATTGSLSTTATTTSAGGSGATTSSNSVGSGGASSSSMGSGGMGPSTEGSGGAGASSGTNSGSTGATTGGENFECTRAFLDGLVDDYFAALSTGDPSSLPLAPNLKFTENAQEGEIGSTGFWENAGETKYSQRALDTDACSVAVQAVTAESGVDLPIALRIKVERGEMTEIETIVVRPGDYTASFAVDSNPAAIISIADDIGWHDEIPEAERATREELTAWIDRYFRTFPSGVCDVTGDCKRLENGGGNFSCSTGASCSGSPGQGGTLIPRVIIVDEVRGIAAGLTIFDFQTTGHLDMHMIKMSGGQVHAVQAILRDTNGESGWD